MARGVIKPILCSWGNTILSVHKYHSSLKSPTSIIFQSATLKIEKCISDLFKNSIDLISLVEIVKVKERRVLDKQDETLNLQKQLLEKYDEVKKSNEEVLKVQKKILEKLEAIDRNSSDNTKK